MTRRELVHRLVSERQQHPGSLRRRDQPHLRRRTLPRGDLEPSAGWSRCGRTHPRRARRTRCRGRRLACRRLRPPHRKHRRRVRATTVDTRRLRRLSHFSINAVFAYGVGRDFRRAADHQLWAHQSHGLLLSAPAPYSHAGSVMSSTTSRRTRRCIRKTVAPGQPNRDGRALERARTRQQRGLTDAVVAEHERFQRWFS